MIPLLNRGGLMKGFVQGADRQQTTLLPECLDDWVDESNPVRAVDVFVDALELGDLGFDGVDPAATGRPAYHPSPMLKLYIYGYLNRVQSSLRLEREAGRNLEVMWLTGRLSPDHKTIADFRKDNGAAIKKVCAQFVELCRKMGLLTKAHLAAQLDELRANLFDRCAIVLAEVGDGFVIRREPSGQPHHLKIAASLTLQPQARLDPVEIAVNVELEHRRRMVRRPAGRSRIDAIEPEVAEFQRIDEHIDRANRIALVDPIIEAFR